MDMKTQKLPLGWLRYAALCAAVLGVQPALAQFTMVPAPLCPPPRESAKDVDREFRIDAARHLYACFPMRIFRGKMPPMLYGVMVVETEFDATGAVVNVNVVRKPAADEVGPFVVALIKRASPFPAPVKMPGGTAKIVEIFLVDKSGLFQVDAITEGQR
jgi:hypothetical protein